MQTAPIRLLDTLCPKPIHKFWLLIAFYIAWLLVFSLMLWKSAFAADVPGFGAPVNIGCGARFWSAPRSRRFPTFADTIQEQRQ